MKFFFLLLIFVSITALSEESLQIDAGENYQKYSNEELRQRVWKLEKAVAQIQKSQKAPAPVAPPAPVAAPEKVPKEGSMWTCWMPGGGAEPSVSEMGTTREKALSATVRKCTEASSARHCAESTAKCTNN